ncbi:MAG: RNA methyltransferase [Spirochaetaceae bacterium]|jgi:TrmH family RNA methyltransferase|nr:RNA methyltransferase [Spirochaetaceae bacterium]
MTPLLSRIIIVLCRPEGGGNVGSICRAMKNMGLSRLALVSPSETMDLKHLKTMAVHAEEIYQQAQLSENLSDILASVVFSAGITRRRGTRRKRLSYLPEEFCEKASSISEGDIALVFGNEKNGLNEQELACCCAAVHIPSSPVHPSLNLSHAVQIMTYSLFRQTENEVDRCVPINDGELHRLTEVIYQSLSVSGSIKMPDRFDNYKFLHDILGRATLSTREANQLTKIFQALRYKEKKE